jgi:hypothetical protein
VQRLERESGADQGARHVVDPETGSGLPLRNAPPPRTAVHSSPVALFSTTARLQLVRAGARDRHRIHRVPVQVVRRAIQRIDDPGPAVAPAPIVTPGEAGRRVPLVLLRQDAWSGKAAGCALDDGGLRFRSTCVTKSATPFSDQSSTPRGPGARGALARRPRAR